MGFMGWRHLAGRSTTARYLAAFLLLAAYIAPGLAANRCVPPSGRVLYTDGRCETGGAKRQGEVKDLLQVVPPQDAPAARRPASPAAKEAATARNPFRKASNSPVLT